MGRGCAKSQHCLAQATLPSWLHSRPHRITGHRKPTGATSAPSHLKVNPAIAVPVVQPHQRPHYLQAEVQADPSQRLLQLKLSTRESKGHRASGFCFSSHFQGLQLQGPSAQRTSHDARRRGGDNTLAIHADWHPELTYHVNLPVAISIYFLENLRAKQASVAISAQLEQHWLSDSMPRC